VQRGDDARRVEQHHQELGQEGDRLDLQLGLGQQHRPGLGHPKGRAHDADVDVLELAWVPQRVERAVEAARERRVLLDYATAEVKHVQQGALPVVIRWRSTAERWTSPGSRPGLRGRCCRAAARGLFLS
jgi:hypothetical protein